MRMARVHRITFEMLVSRRAAWLLVRHMRKTLDRAALVRKAAAQHVCGFTRRMMDTRCFHMQRLSARFLARHLRRLLVREHSRTYLKAVVMARVRRMWYIRGIDAATMIQRWYRMLGKPDKECAMLVPARLAFVGAEIGG